MRSALLEILRCPRCAARLDVATVREGDASDVREGALRCRGDAHAWPIVRGVPRFVASHDYARNFSFQYTVHKKTQIEGASRDEAARTFEGRTGLALASLAGRAVLDVGCGAGKFLNVASETAGLVVGVDLSYAVETAQANCGARPNVHVVQADLRAMPFAPEAFDVVFSIGVLHHTPDTKAAFTALPPLLRRGGELAIWVYSAHFPYYVMSDLYRRVTRRLPGWVLWAICAAMAPVAYLYRIPALGPALKFFTLVDDHPNLRWRVLKTYDWYAAEHQHKHRYAEVFEWFRDAGLADIEPREPPVAMRGVKR